MRRTAAVIMVALGALALGACGDDDDDNGGGGGGDVEVSEEAQPYVDAVAEQLQTTEEGELQLNAEQAECVAPRWVDAIGIDRFEENGITPEVIAENELDDLNEIGLDEATGNEMYDAFGACDVDVPALLLESLAGDEDIPSEALDCLEGALDDDLVREIMVVTITGGDDALDEDSELGQRINDTFAECAPDGG